MFLVKVKRSTRLEKRYSKKMGSISVKVTYIRKHIFGIPLRTIHKYRQTYYGNIKDCADCVLTA